MNEYMYVKLTQEWGGFRIDDVIRFGWNKGEIIVNAGKGIQVSKQRAVNDPPEPVKEKPKIETAMATPKAETAEVTPEIIKGEAPKSRRGKKRKNGE